MVKYWCSFVKRSIFRKPELGHIIYVSGGTISNYEKGVHYPDVEKLVRLADYFNVSIDYLLGRSTSKLSPDVFAQTVSDDTTVGDVVQSLQRLSPARKQCSLHDGCRYGGSVYDSHCQKEGASLIPFCILVIEDDDDPRIYGCAVYPISAASLQRDP